MAGMDTDTGAATGVAASVGTGADGEAGRLRLYALKCVPKAPLLAAGRARQVLNERRALQQSGGSHPFVPLLHGLLDASERLALSTRPG